MLDTQARFHLPLTFSYAGALPFIFFTGLASRVIEFSLLADPQILYFTHLAYAGLILFFMAGANWGKALYNGNQKQYAIAMTFSLIGFALLLFAMVFDYVTHIPLGLFGFVFIAFYVAERWAMQSVKDMISFKNYDLHRKILTTIVALCLFGASYFHMNFGSYY